jgi:exodeoxyribonuclease VII small subunit
MPDEPRFEQALAELDRILRELEDGTTTLDDSLARYERGVSLLRVCYGQLREAEQKIQLLSGRSPDGTPELLPFEHTAAVEKERPAAKRKSKPPPERPAEPPY